MKPRQGHKQSKADTRSSAAIPALASPATVCADADLPRSAPRAKGVSGEGKQELVKHRQRN